MVQPPQLKNSVQTGAQTVNKIRVTRPIERKRTSQPRDTQLARHDGSWEREKKPNTNLMWTDPENIIRVAVEARNTDPQADRFNTDIYDFDYGPRLFVTMFEGGRVDKLTYTS